MLPKSEKAPPSSLTPSLFEVMHLVDMCFGRVCLKFCSDAGVGANFSTFGEAFHLIFQLMFGEDMPTLWNDCAISYPECTKDFYDVHGKVVL